MWRVMIYGVLMWAVALYAFRRGGWEEKAAAAGLITSSYLSALLIRPSNVAYQSIETSVLYLDLAYFLLMLLIVMRSRKFWPMWNTAMAAVTITAHLLPYMPQAHPYIYWRAEALWSYPMWVVMAVGVRQHWKDKFRQVRR